MKRLKILVVEDDGVVAFLLGQSLEDMGYEVCDIVGNAADAIAAAGLCKPDLMIVDEQLGDESGVALVETVLRDGPMAHLFVSGDVARIRALAPSAIVLEKPYFETDLEQAIWRALARRSEPPLIEPLQPTDDGPAADPRRCA